MFFLFLKAKGNNRHPLCNPGLSKHFFEIKTKLANAQTVVFIPKKSRHSNLITIDYLTKTNIKQNFVKEKITV